MRVCFIDHRHEEHQSRNWKAETETSKSNQYEAQLVAYVCRYLIQQGHEPKDITVLTTYLGQVVEVNKELSQVMAIPILVTIHIG